MRYEVIVDGLYITTECLTNNFNEAWECFLNTDSAMLYDGNELIASKTF